MHILQHEWESNQLRRRGGSCLTYDICLALAAVVIRSVDLHLHKGTDDAAAIFRQMTGPQHLIQEQRMNVESRYNTGNV